jgi:hypothetical protein
LKAHSDFVGSIKPCLISCWHFSCAALSYEGVIPGCVAFVGLMSSFNLKGSWTKNSSFFQRGLGCLKRSWLSAHSFNNFSWISSYPAGASAKEKSFGIEQNGLKSLLCFSPFAKIESLWRWTQRRVQCFCRAESDCFVRMLSPLYYLQNTCTFFFDF